MSVPEREDIDEMVTLIGGPNASFDALPPADKMRIIELVNQGDAVDELRQIREGIGNLDHELTKVGDWFKNSKLWEGRVDR